MPAPENRASVCTIGGGALLISDSRATVDAQYRGTVPVQSSLEDRPDRRGFVMVAVG